jgi:hypothetical protein
MPTDRTRPIALTDPELDGGAELLGATVTFKPVALPGGDRPSAVGAAPATAAGRADDFSWRGRDAAPAPASDITATASTGPGIAPAPATTD